MRIRATGNLAMFARPEMTTDICSYDMITQSAARGLMESIFWHPCLKWVINRIMALKDVDYVIETHFDMTNATTPSDNTGKFAVMSKRRLQNDTLIISHPLQESILSHTEVFLSNHRTHATL